MLAEFAHLDDAEQLPSEPTRFTDTTRPNAKPASMIDTCVVVASAHSANKMIRLIRSSSANS